MSSGILRYHHITHNITRNNIARARRFYGEVLGLKEIEPLGDPKNERLIWFAVGNQQLHLVISEHAEPPTSRHLAVLVEDFDRFVARLRMCAAPLDPVRIRDDGSKVTWCYDPDRNRIELMSHGGGR